AVIPRALHFKQPISHAARRTHAVIPRYEVVVIEPALGEITPARSRHGPVAERAGRETVAGRLAVAGGKVVETVQFQRVVGCDARGGEADSNVPIIVIAPRSARAGLELAFPARLVIRPGRWRRYGSCLHGHGRIRPRGD